LLDPAWNEVGDGEIGEIAIRGHNVMKGYLNRPEATAEAIRDGWFRTGDIGRRDEDGYYYIVDRAKDMIVRGGFNVYPRELEEVLMTHPAVSLAAVIGVPSASHGEEVKAVVIKKGGAEIAEAELMAWCKENMADYKYPRIVEFREALPMTATGKVPQARVALNLRSSGLPAARHLAATNWNHTAVEPGVASAVGFSPMGQGRPAR
jgi:long-chain acyl-CoA synthetase